MRRRGHGPDDLPAALGAPTWPWPDQSVFVLTSSPLPEGTPPHVVAVDGGPMRRSPRCAGAAAMPTCTWWGGPRTIAAVHGVGALGSLELVVLPVLLGDGPSLWSNDAGMTEARMVGPPRAHPDRSLQLTYVLT